MTVDDVAKRYSEALASMPDITPPVAAIKTLVELVAQSDAKTTTELSLQLKSAERSMRGSIPNSIALGAGCHLFNTFAEWAMTNSTDFDASKEVLVKRGREFVESAPSFREKIADIGLPFIQDDAVILIHSYSRVVMRLLQHAAAANRRFSVYVTESRPSHSGVKAVRSLRKLGIPAQLILDSAVGYMIEKVDLVLVGAEGVCETGGIINHIGTYQVAIVARERRKPFYVVTESFKFVRRYPLGQYDLGIQETISALKVDEHDGLELYGESGDAADGDGTTIYPQLVAEMEQRNPLLDYTPPSYITLLFTDKGVLTPSGVSDELIRLFSV
ncbi:translation initiation factor eIF-2B subunit alpha [Sorochytrium milnesiophthora]